MVGAGIICHIKHHLVIIIHSLHIFVNFLFGLVELIDRIIAFIWIYIQLLFGLGRFKCISLLNGVRLVPTIGVPFLLSEDTVTMGAAMGSGLLLFTPYIVRLAFLAKNPRARLTIRISPIRLISLILLGGMLLGFTSCTPPVIPGIKVPKRVNTLFGRNGVIVGILFSTSS